MSGATVASTASNKLNSFNKKIAEIKKKIQLSEGQRKANFESCDTKKHENAQRIIQLKKEVKDLYIAYVKAKNNEEAAERAVEMCRTSSAPVKARSLNDTIVTVDEDIVRLRKKFDLIKYQHEKEQERLRLLMSEREELKHGKAQIILKRKTENPLRKKIISLEIQLEHVKMMHAKANALRRKYKSIYGNVKKKTVTYASSLKALEDSIVEQENEVSRLKGVKEEAIDLRNNTQETLVRQEFKEAAASKDRDFVIKDFRQRVIDRKMELERLERMIFPARPRDDFDTRGEKSRMQDGTEDIIKDEVMRLEQAFGKLRNATGVSRFEDVLNRFLGQRATKESVQKMRTAAEHEKMILEKKRQELTAEIEMQKFSETKNAEQNAEDVENLHRQISEQVSRREKAEEKIEKVRDLIDEMTVTLRSLCYTLWNIPEGVPDDPSETEDPVLLLEILENIIRSSIEAFGTTDEYFEKLDGLMVDKIETMSVATTFMEGKSLRPKPLFSRFPSSAIQGATLSEDEEEVPTRNTLKRQAQMLVDSKTRRKGFAFKR